MSIKWHFTTSRRWVYGGNKLDQLQHFYTWGKGYNIGVEQPHAQWIISNPKTKVVHFIIKVADNRQQRLPFIKWEYKYKYTHLTHLVSACTHMLGKITSQVINIIRIVQVIHLVISCYLYPFFRYSTFLKLAHIQPVSIFNSTNRPVSYTHLTLPTNREV